MPKIDSVYLDDILSAIKTIESYVDGVGFETFQTEEMRHDASIRQLEIIGEAANQLSPDFRQTYPSFPVRQAISMRNFLIHGYDEVNLEVVWSTILKNLPILKKEAEAALKQLH